MKSKYSFVLVVFFLISCSHTKHIGLTEKDREQIGLYKIKRIIDYGKLFDIIDAQKNDSLFRIISLKDSVTSNHRLFEAGKKYPLNLMQIYPNPLIEQGVDNAGIGAIDSFFIGLPERCSKLHVALNLNGSYLLENDKDSTALIHKFGVYTIICQHCKKNKITVRLYIK